MDAPVVDWMEWQACYASGALLMPKTAITAFVEDFRRAGQAHGLMSADDANDSILIAKTAKRFSTSREATRVRLIKLGFLVKGPKSPSLFD